MKLTASDQIRIDVINKYLLGEIHREHAQSTLELGERQFRRLVKRFKECGIRSLRHGNCGNLPKNKTSQEIENKILSLAKGKLAGFNMTHFREKLLEEHPDSIFPSYSTIRRIFTDNNLYQPHKRRRKRPHRSRDRYQKEGLMIQIDGSPHAWFGHTISCLIAAIDDATGKILGAQFSPTETTFGTMDVLEQVLINHGVFQIP